MTNLLLTPYSLGLGKNTTAQLQAFRKRSDEAKRTLTALKAQSTEVDLEHYRKVLRVSCADCAGM